MKKKWFAGDFCPRNATCSTENGALIPTNGPKIRTLNLTEPIDQLYTATIEVFENERSFFDAGTEPGEWVKCEGQLLSIPQYMALFSLLGTNYGGDGRTNFGVPDLKNETAGPYYIYREADIGHGR